MGKKHKIRWLVLILIIIAIILFISLNYTIFSRKMSILKGAKEACDGLDINNSCEFYRDGNLNSGVCEKVKKEKIICKREAMKKYFPK